MLVHTYSAMVSWVCVMILNCPILFAPRCLASSRPSLVPSLLASLSLSLNAFGLVI